MESTKKEIKYPENLPLRDEVKESGFTVKHLAKKVGCSKWILSQTINGHYKGTNIVPRLKAQLNK